MTRQVKLALIVFSAPLVAACGGGSGDSTSEPPPSFAELEAEAVSLFQGIVLIGNTPLANMPVAGTASFNGVAGAYVDRPISTIDDADMLGRLAMTADFADGSVAGQIDSFRSSENAIITGQLGFEGPIVNSSFTADATGALTQGGETSNIVLDMDGGFGGNQYEVIAGEFSGSATSGLDVSTVEGFFYGTR